MGINFSGLGAGFERGIKQTTKVFLSVLVGVVFVAACAGPPTPRSERVQRYVPLPDATQLEAGVTDSMPTVRNWQGRLGDFATSQRPGIDSFEWREPVKGSFRKVDSLQRSNIKITEYMGWYGCGMARYATVPGEPRRREVPVAGVFRDNKLLAKLYWGEEASEVCRMLPGFVVSRSKEDFPETGFNAQGYVPPIIDEAASNVRSKSAYSYSDMDLDNSVFEVVKSYELQRELCNWDVVTTKTGYLELCHSNNLSLSFLVQNLSNFKRGMRSRGLFGREGQADPSVHRHHFFTGPGLYSHVTYKKQNCVAFVINTGVKTLAGGSKPATRSLFAGLHCRPADGDEAFKLLISEIDKVRIRR